MNKKKNWRHPRFKKANYTGTYIRVEGERVFELKRQGGNGHRFTVESHQAAVKLGWFTV